MGLAPVVELAGPGSQVPDEWPAESLATEGSLLDLPCGEGNGTLKLAHDSRLGRRSCSSLLTDWPGPIPLPVGEPSSGGVVALYR